MHIHFKPESDEFTNAANEYFEIWKEEGEKITQTLLNVMQLPEPKDFTAIIYEGVSRSGYDDRPMKLRASYAHTIKVGTLIHELGHRYLSQLNNRPDDMDEHRILDLVLYDIWTDLYGMDFASENMIMESKRKGIYDYKKAWEETLKLSREQRLNRYKEILAMSFYDRIC